MGPSQIYVQYGMKRSGTHAVSNVLQGALTPHFFNNVVPMGPVFEGTATVPPLVSFKTWFLSPDLSRAAFTTRADASDMARVYASFEDMPLTLDAFREDAPTNILVLRTFENMMSSRLRKGFAAAHPAYPTAMGPVMTQICETWKQHARSYLRRDCPDRIAILFDAWVADPAYRAQVAARLDIDIAQQDPHRVSDVGGGSSFDGTAYDGRPGDMQVLSRAQLLTPPERAVLEQVMQDPEIPALSEQIAAVAPQDQI